MGGQHLDMNGELGIIEVDAPALCLFDESAHLTLDLRRRERKPLVGAPGGNPKRRGSGVAEVGEYRRCERAEIVRGAPGAGKIGNSEDATDAVARFVPTSRRAGRMKHRRRRELDFDPAHYRAHRGDVEVLENRAQVLDQPLDEPRPVASFERKLLVVDDYRV